MSNVARKGELQAKLIDALSDDDTLDILGPSAAKAPRARPPQESTAVLVNLGGVQPERVSWLWPGRIPLGKLTVLDGDPGLGKSHLMLDLAARVTTGQRMPDGSVGISGGVVLLTAEDGLADTVRPRLDAAGAQCDFIVALTGIRLTDYERAPSLPDDLAQLEEAILRVGAKLVVIDPLMAFLGANVDSWRDQDVRRALHQLAQLAERTGAAIVVVRHLNKGSGAHAIYRGGGSIGIIGAARAGLLVAKDPDDERRRVLAVVKANLSVEVPSLTFAIESTENSSRVVWGGESPHGANALVSQLGDAEERGTLDTAKAFLNTELHDGPRPSKEINGLARDAGIAQRTLGRARETLGVSARRIGGVGASGSWFLSLPNTANPPLYGNVGTLSGSGVNSARPDNEITKDAKNAIEREVGVLSPAERAPGKGDAWEPAA